MRNRFLPVLLALALLGPEPGAAQLKKIKTALGLKPSEEKEARQRLKVEALAKELYETDPDFKEAVENHYREVLREHSERVYRINTSTPSKAVIIRGDRFRRHSQEGLTLYDNLAIQTYVNRLGQHFAPADSRSLFAFRLVATPIPYAEALSTGTIYLSTGLIALLDNEAQLAYVLSHEMAHVYKEHWKWKSKLLLGADEYMARKQKKQAVWKVLGGAALGAVIGAQVGGREVVGAAIGGLAGAAVALAKPKLNLEWDVAQEAEADEIAFRALQAANYDVLEVGKLYANLSETILQDTRATVGFFGRPDRLSERQAYTDKLIQRALEAPSSAAAELGYLIDTRRYKELMAELRRDNGIQALFHDMFQIARTNLRQAFEIRSNDPTSLYYYGKVLELVGQTDAELDEAKELFRLAAQNDFRNWNFGSHLHYALMLMEEGTADAADLAEKELQKYIDGYSDYQLQEFAMRQLPSHLDTLYDYMMLNGRAGWAPTLPEAPEGFAFASGALPAGPGD
jgi:predicted Zn-dependent protease